MASHLLIYEINTRIWLNELSERAGEAIRLKNVPDSELDRLAGLGFHCVWLMGVWEIGPTVRAKALAQWEAEWKHEIPSSSENVTGSPFANRFPSLDPSIASYGEMQEFHVRLCRKGILLMLDFVPNHLGRDHVWVETNPALFVQSPSAKPGTFQCKTKFGKRHFAHGRDPFFPPWNDTIQIDYGVPENQQLMAELAGQVSPLCDGFRCDMSMLVLDDIFSRTWRDFPPARKRAGETDFWPLTFQRITQNQIIDASFLMLAEAYWDTEERLQEMGFHFTYLKRIYDFLIRRQIPELQAYLFNLKPKVLEGGCHFLENHDEPRIASLLAPAEHQAAALFMFGLPGAHLMHDGQLEGRKKFARIQMNVRFPEEPDPEIALFYEKLLNFKKECLAISGEFSLIKPLPIEWWDNSWQNLFLLKWQDGGIVELVIVNLGPGGCKARIPEPAILQDWISLKGIFSCGEAGATLPGLIDGHWHFDMPPYSGQVVRFFAKDMEVGLSKELSSNNTAQE